MPGRRALCWRWQLQISSKPSLCPLFSGRLAEPGHAPRAARQGVCLHTHAAGSRYDHAIDDGHERLGGAPHTVVAVEPALASANPRCRGGSPLATVSLVLFLSPRWEVVAQADLRLRLLVRGLAGREKGRDGENKELTKEGKLF